MRVWWKLFLLLHEKLNQGMVETKTKKNLREHTRLLGSSEGVWTFAEKYIECNLPVELPHSPYHINLLKTRPAEDMSSF